MVSPDPPSPLVVRGSRERMIQVLTNLILNATQAAIRAGYSANADVIIREKKDVLVLPERLVTFEDGGNRALGPAAAGDPLGHPQAGHRGRRPDHQIRRPGKDRVGAAQGVADCALQLLLRGHRRQARPIQEAAHEVLGCSLPVRFSVVIL